MPIHPCPRCDRPAPIAARICPGCGAVLAGAAPRARAALARAQAALEDPDLPQDVAQRARALLAARAASLAAAPARPAPRPAPSRPKPAAAPPPPAAPTLWQRLGPAFAEHLLFVVGAFLLLAGAAYFTSTAWTTMSGISRLALVQGGLTGLAALVAGLGRLLNRDGRLDDLEAVARPVAAGLAAGAVIAAGQLAAVQPVPGAVACGVGAALAGAAAGFAAGRQAALPAALFALAAGAAPAAAGWPVLAQGLLGLGLALACRGSGPRITATVGLAWLAAAAHLAVLGGALGVAAAGAGLAALLGSAGPSRRAVGLALAVGALPASLGDPVALCVAALFGAGGALTAGLRADARGVFAGGLLLSFAAYLTLPAPARALLEPLRQAASAGLGYAEGRLPLAWYTLTGLPYLLALGLALGPLAARRPALAAVTGRWLAWVALGLAALAPSAGELRPVALGWGGLALVALALDRGRRLPVLGLGGATAALGALAAAVAWADGGVGALAGGAAGLVLGAALAQRWGATAGLEALRLGAGLLCLAASAWASVEALALGPPGPAEASGLALASLALVGLGQRPWAQLGLAAPILAAAAALELPAGLLAAPVVLAIGGGPALLGRLGFAALVGLSAAGLPAGALSADGGHLALGLAVIAVTARAAPGWPQGLAGLLAPGAVALAAALAHGPKAGPVAAAAAVVAGALLQALPRAWPGRRAQAAALGASAAVILGLVALAVLDPPSQAYGRALLSASLVLGALLVSTGRILNGIWAVLGLAGLALGVAAAARAWELGAPGMGLACVAAGALALALDRRWAAGRPGAHLAAGILGLVALLAGAVALGRGLDLGTLSLAGAVLLGLWAGGWVGAVGIPAGSFGLVAWGALQVGEGEALAIGAVAAAAAGLLVLGEGGRIRGLGRRGTLVWALLVALPAGHLALEGLVDQLAGLPRGPERAQLAWLGLGALLWRLGERLPAGARPSLRLLAAALALAGFSPITRWFSPGFQSPPAFELLALGILAALRAGPAGPARLALGLALALAPGAAGDALTASTWSLGAAAFGLRAWRHPARPDLDLGAALWLGAAAILLWAAVLTGHPPEAPALWPVAALALTGLSLAAHHPALRSRLPAQGPLSAAGAVAAVLAVALAGAPTGPAAALALALAAGHGAARAWWASAERLWALAGVPLALAALHGALAHRTGWLALLDGHHLEAWSALALLVVGRRLQPGARERLARGLALGATLPALAAADDALGLARAAALAALVFAVAGHRAEQPALRRLALALGNAAVLATWAAFEVVDPALYGLPPGLTLVALAELDRARLAPRDHLSLLAGGLTLAYGSVAVQVLQVGSPLHAGGLLALGLAALALGWRQRRAVLLFGGAAGVALAPVGYLLRAGFQRGFLGAGLLVLLGIAVLSAAAVAARRRR